MLKRTFKAFEYPEFRLMWAGACISSIGTWMQQSAQSWLVLEISGSARLLGLDAFLGQIPIFLFSLVGGVIADRYDRRILLIGSQIVQLACAFVLAALFATNVVQIWHILTLSFVVGLAQAFGGPAYSALVPTLVPKEHLSNAIALNSIQFNVARVIGPVLGGLALTKLGAAWCFSLNGLSYLVVIGALLYLRPSFTPSNKGGTIVEGIQQGIGFIRKQAAMESLIALAFCMTALSIPLVVFLPVVTREVLMRGSETFTNLLSVSGLGSITGALFVASTAQSKHKGRLALITMTFLGLIIVGFSFSRNIWLTAVLVFVAGAALIMVFALITSLVQLITPDDLRGRVMSVYNVAFRGGMPMGSLATGQLIPLFTAPPVLAANGALLAALGLWYLLVHRKVAQL
ncbi:MAG: MFS transporter [Bryobacteraceae bacterium]|nr:MFS transporter [Bryobacteraceae bacterium]